MKSGPHGKYPVARRHGPPACTHLYARLPWTRGPVTGHGNYACGSPDGPARPSPLLIVRLHVYNRIGHKCVSISTSAESARHGHCSILAAGMKSCCISGMRRDHVGVFARHELLQRYMPHFKLRVSFVYVVATSSF